MGAPSELTDLPATEQRRLLADRAVSATELLDAHLAVIDAVNPAVNAIIALDPEVGRARARAVDDAVARGDDPGPLAGLVTAHKDLTETADFPTTYGSPLFAGFRPAADSLLVARMRAAGAVAVGKTNTPELGAGSHTFNPVHGLTRNPWGLDRSAGGSSGGAAVALACRMVAVADGSDMGGSLRNPAAWNGVVGFRPTPASCRGSVPATPGRPWRSRVRWVARSPTSPSSSACSADPTPAIPCTDRSSCRSASIRPTARCASPGRRDIGGVAIDPAQVGGARRVPADDRGARLGRRRRRARPRGRRRVLPHAAGVAVGDRRCRSARADGRSGQGHGLRRDPARPRR